MPATKEKKTQKPRNFQLSAGIMRFSKSAMYKKRGIWKKKKAGQKPKEAAPRQANTVEKTIGGDKNGGKRKVLSRKAPRFYPTEDRRGKRNQRKSHRIDTRERITGHSKKLRKSIQPGSVLILLAGRHKGKHVVCLKQLQSGLLLITGPWKINGVPLRRVNQRYVIATRTRVNIEKVKLAENLNDNYFRRVKAKAPKDAGIFDQKAEAYKPSEQRVKDQVDVDNQVLSAIKAEKDGKLLRDYLSSLFQLKNKQYPHQMVF
ncbi:60S ribosomal protein L6-like [Paramacrobiotus metropolitanus]|uniref:60S ribosomal protein L6-like n=1 Tax=Paramacrobiotus metropolitanus TaxID=2943436 RepID=UPI002445E95B|nr:60S ribosomal protein L6-like [Paramacrobiotus metropolitanus]